MRLPQPLLESVLFQFATLDDFMAALGCAVEALEAAEIRRLVEIGLPPITSHTALSTLLGINAGLLQAFERHPERFYRSFSIPKGKTVRFIQAPQVGLKIIQKWLSVHISKRYVAKTHVFGFVQGRSHIDAAKVHVGADWVLSMDIENFFPTTARWLVIAGLQDIGYNEQSASMIANFACYRGNLAQGSPLSPTLSNICFKAADDHLLALANSTGCRLSRYADDIVLSGLSAPPAGLEHSIRQCLAETPWKFAAEKTRCAVRPARLKVHGLLVSGDRIRLTKGYRNRIRALRHLQSRDLLVDDVKVAIGHLHYARQIEMSGQR